MTAKPIDKSPYRPTARIRLRMAALLVVGSAGATAQDAPGTFGFMAKVDADGLFNPRLKSVLIESVVPGLPAATAGIAAGDMVVEVQGRAVLGAAASDMRGLMRRAPGQKLTLKLRRPGGEIFVVELTAVKQP